MTGRAHKLLAEALSLSDDERLDLAEQLLSSLPADPEWLAKRAETERDGPIVASVSNSILEPTAFSSVR